MKAELIQSVGSDLTVVNAARVSFDKESKYEARLSYEFYGDNDYVEREYEDRLSEKDAKLISYLAKHNHFTPFTHCFITMRETVPIFVARQRFKHTVGFSYNEVSRRYVDGEPKFFEPKAWRKRAENKKQGSADETIDGYWYKYPDEDGDLRDSFMDFNSLLDNVHLYAVTIYNTMLENGVCPEQARMVLPQSMYTSYYVSGSLAAWARFYNLRVDPHAQAEIQDLARDVGKLIEPLFPVSWEALTKQGT